MRNLKKILALVLALMMVLSMMVTASALDFNDAAEIDSKHEVAVEVMAGLGILKGNPKEDGSFDFDPNGTITREQAAKIIAYTHAGSENAVKDMAKDFDHPFTDVAEGHWSENWIAYCYNMGLTNGVSATAYGSKQTLTGLQLAKMMLVAAGFYANEDFTAENWQTETRVALKELSLTGNLSDITWSAPISREHAAQLVWNVMTKAPTVSTTMYEIMGISSGFITNGDAVDGERYDTKAQAIAAGVGVMTDGSTTAAVYNQDFVVEEVVVTSTDNTKTMAYDKFTLQQKTVTIVSNQATKPGQGYTETTDGNYNIETGLDLIGHRVTVYYKSAWTSSTSKGTTYAVVDTSKVVTVAAAKKGLTANEVKSLFGLQTAPTAGSAAAIDTLSNYTVNDDNSTALITVNANDATKFDVAAGEYIINNKRLNQSYYKYEASAVDTITITVDDADEGYYTVTDGSANVIAHVEDPENDNDENNLKGKIDWLSLVTKENPSPATYVYTVDMEGDYYILSDVNTIVGQVTKIATIDAVPYVYIDGVPYVANSLLTDEVTALGLTNIGTNPAFATEYRFYIDGTGYSVFGYESTEESDAPSVPNLIVPVAFYHKSAQVTTGGDAYTEGSTGTVYTYWIQGVDMNGNEVNLQVADAATGAQLFTSALTAATGVYTVDEAALNELYTYTVAYDSTLKANVASFVAVGAIDANTDLVSAEDAAGVVADTAKKVTIGSNHYYLNDTFKVICITGSKTTLKVTVLDADASVVAAGDILYGVRAAEGADRNFELAYVIAKHQPSTAVASDELIYVDAASTSTVIVPVDLDGDGKLESGEVAYEHSVYINGVKKTILTKNADGTDGVSGVALDDAGFYSFSVDSKTGIYTLADFSTNVKVNEAVVGNYKGLVTVDDLNDYIVAGATVINLTNNANLVTDATKLTSEYEISCIYNPLTETISLIYITDYTPSGI